MAYEPISKSENTIGTFYGYNHNPRTGDGEFYDMQNLTSSYFPLLSTRHKRGTTLVTGGRTKTGDKTNRGSGLHCIFGKNKFGYIKDEKLYYDGEEVEGLEFPDIEQERHIVSMGAYLLIFPDKKYVNTADLTDYGDIEKKYLTASDSSTTINDVYTSDTEPTDPVYGDLWLDTSGEDDILKRYSCAGGLNVWINAQTTYDLCDKDGNLYFENEYVYQTTAPTDPSDGDYWIDKSSSPRVLKQYSADRSMWVVVPQTFIRISQLHSPTETERDMHTLFNKYDSIKITGSYSSYLNGTHRALYGVSKFYIVIESIVTRKWVKNDVINIVREVPDMDLFCDGENRVWGCNSEKNEIYACKLGDFKNWNSFAGNSTDSYAVSVGTDGVFTGAIRYSSSVLFFKENCVHKIYNTNPPYQVSTTVLNGVQKGSHRSLCIVNSRLYYLSPVGVCSYEGSTSSLMDNVFGTEYHHSGVGGEYRGKYYISLSTSVPIITGTITIEILGIQMPIPVFGIESFRELFVYDTARGLWHKENLQVSEFASYDNNLFFVEEKKTIGTDTTTINCSLGLIDATAAYGDYSAGLYSDYGTEKYFDWYAETGLLGLDYAGHKYINAVSVRLKLSPTGVPEYPSFVKLYAEYDSSGKWVMLDEIKAQETHGFTVKASIPRRCDHMRLKIEGRGECLIYSITLQTEGGSEL